MAGLTKTKTKPNPKLKLELKFGDELCNTVDNDLVSVWMSFYKLSLDMLTIGK